MRPASALLAAALLIAGWAWASSKPAPTRRVLLISIDTLRADALQGTPGIEALARDSAVFTRAWSPAPWTLPALASVMTGVSPQVHLATGLGDRVPDRVTTLAEALRRRGLRTAAIVSSPLLGREVNLSQGFQEYTVFSSHPATPPRLADLASRWLRAHGKGGFFLWVHFYDPHTPWEPPPAYLKGMEPPPGMGPRLTAAEHLAIRLGERVPSPAEREWMRRLYEAEVRWVDDAVGSLMADLKGSGLYDGTLIVLLSDHGEEFWDHGGIGHGHTLHGELLRVPFLLKLPGSAPRAVDVPISTASVAATILDLTGTPLPADYPAARSLVPLLRGESLPPEPLLATGLQRIEERQAVLFGDYKLIRWQTSGRQELYDLARDPGEKTDLSASLPDRIAEGTRLLDRFEAESDRARKRLGITRRERIPLDPETRERLKALGYGK
ncbi:MAG TPA: sulfatase [Thermoanaerobaculia bacterium]|jgi:arylsulfatase A-like enzyme|nr:sulfatase [Thermoanaerobaculia bacterium]